MLERLVSESVRPSVIQTKTTKVPCTSGFVHKEKHVDNVIQFPGKAPKDPDFDPVEDFIEAALIPWAVENEIDVDSMLFKLNAAGIMACMQGMLLSNDN